jgi:hypothetical protein
MDGAPARVGIAGDWHGNAEWAVRTISKISARLPRHGPRIILQLGDFGIWPGPDGREYPARLDADLRRSDAHRDLLREIVLAVRPRWLMHGHLHLSYQRRVDLGGGQIEVTGLDCDGAPSGNWAILDTASMRWLRFHGRPIRNAVRSLVAD